MIQGPDSWEGLGDELGQVLRLQKVTVSELWFEDSHACIDPCTMDQLTKIVGLVMQWASPEMLETVQCSSDFLNSVAARIIQGGNSPC